MPRLRVAACQLNLVVGDLEGNATKILDAIDQAEIAECDLAVFPELAITGYPPEDLLLKPGFVADNRAALDRVAAGTGRCAAVVGFVDAGRDLYNAAAVCANGTVQGVYRKRLLPNYGVFDEQRYFAAGHDPGCLFVIGGVRVGVVVCEDAWSPDGPIADQSAGGAELIVNLNASPYHAARLDERERMLATRALDSSCSLVYVNLVGGQDELVFDGASLVLDTQGRVVARAPQFVEDVMVVDVDVKPVFRKRLLDPRGRAMAPPLPEVAVSLGSAAQRSPGPPPCAEPLDPDHEIYEALVLGTRDYVTKTGFTDVVIGLSGGVDSSLVAAIATDALGPDHVHGVMMPSRYSSEGSLTDAKELAEALGIEWRVIGIEEVHDAFLQILGPSFAGVAEDLTEENIQARIRGATLMALSNKFGWMVLATGNKSEMAVGFSTLYGDLAGGFAVIKDVLKTTVYDLCHDRNRRAVEAGATPPIPEVVLTKAPSAELRPDQRDDESLPPYDQLDPVLEAYVEGDTTVTDLEAAGFDPALVRRVVTMVDRSEYKRRQAPPGVRVTPKAFGKDRRLPITNRYRG
ncbi:MAG TPA: NAD+ synthase [Acidimicrobiales bacterium]|nr:NAD+ synthase [Acidimicrobiales bacterium]